jgi:hypothetical protein
MFAALSLDEKKVEFTEDNDEWWLTTGVPKHGPWF